MRDHHHPKNLRRSFGSQPVGCVGRPSWSEAGIAALVIPAQSSRWTSRGQGNVHWRLADLPTCRRADLPTCRRADVPTCRRADVPTCRWMTTRVSPGELSSGRSLGVSLTFNTNVEGFASSRVFRTRQSFPSPRNCPNDYSGVFARHRLSLVKPLTLIVARSQISPRDGYGSWELFVNKCL